MANLRIIEPDWPHDGAILIADADSNDVAEFFHKEHATVGQSYDTALGYAKALVAAADDGARRERLIRFIQPWIDARPMQYQPRVGYAGCGCTLTPDDLSDVALENLAGRICRDFWSTRRRNRINRAIDAARAEKAA